MFRIEFQYSLLCDVVVVESRKVPLPHHNQIPWFEGLSDRVGAE
jgi:hypothetical protein